MDREMIDRRSQDLRDRRATEPDLTAEHAMDLLRREGRSVVESMVIVAQAFDISLGAAKIMAANLEDQQGTWHEIDEFHADLEATATRVADPESGEK